jgi:HSP20 family protein
MADTQRTDKPQEPASGRGSAISTQSSSSPWRNRLSRRDPFGSFGWSPFGGLFQRWNDEMDRMFEDFGFSQGTSSAGPVTMWSPQVEVFQKGNEIVVRADLPGLTKDDVHVDVADNVVTIQGERKHEHEEEREGWYRNERSYGSFYRAVPLPEGTIADSAKAKFKNGVLEVTVQAPPKEVNRGRRLEISD